MKKAIILAAVTSVALSGHYVTADESHHTGQGERAIVNFGV